MAAVAALGVAAGLVLAGGEGEPPPRSGDGSQAAAFPFDFDGDSRPTPAAGRPGAGRGGIAVVGPERVSPAEPQADEEFGAAIASADFDHDGFADLTVGAPGHSTGGRDRVEGAITTLYGSPSGLDRRDMVSGPGSRFPFRLARFGAALAAGDLNGDDYADLAIGVPGGDALPEEARGSGTVRVLFGGEDGLAEGRTLRRPRPSLGRFGSVLAVGDVNGDDREDLVAGAPGVPSASVPGHVSFCAGTDDGPRSCGTLTELEGGPTALAVGDVTGDGFGDVVAGIPVNGYPNPGAPPPAGSLVLWPGSRRGPREHPVTITQDTDNVAGHDQAGDRFGAAIAVGNLDGDGFADIVVGTPGEDEAGGRVTIVFGSRDGLPTASGPIYSQDTLGVQGRLTPGHHFGAAVALLGAGGDGRPPDLLVTAPGSSPSLFRLPGRPGGFTGSGASARLSAGEATLWVG